MKNATKERKRKTRTDKEPVESPPMFPFAYIEEARDRLQTHALMYEYLAQHAADAFRGTDARGPSKLLAMPDGSQRPARIQHVHELELELGRLAHEARSLLRRLKNAQVLTDPEVVVRDGDIPPGPRPPPPPGEGVVDVGGRLPAATDYDRRPRPRDAQR